MNKSPLPHYLYNFLIILIAAVISHICAVFFFQFIVSNPAYNKITHSYVMSHFSEIASQDTTLQPRDPFFKYYVCPFNIRNKSIHIFSKSTSPNFWSLAFYNQKGALVYSSNSELIPHKPLDIILSTPLQLSLLHKYYTEQHIYNATSTLMVARDIEKGIAVLKIYDRAPSELQNVQPFINSTACEII